MERLYLIFGMLCFVTFGNCVRHEINIGAIFGADEYGEQIAFKTALERAGMFGSKLRFATNIISSSQGDSYKTSKAACKLAESGVAAIVAPEAASAAASRLEIPSIQLDWEFPTNNYATSSRMTLNFYPEAVALSSALAALVSDYDWKSFTVLYEDDDGLARLQEVLKSHGPDDPPVTVRKLDPNGDNRPLLKKVETSGETHIILDCHVSRILTYLNEAYEVNLFQDYQSYILTSLDAHTLDLGNLKFGLSNVTTLRMFDPESPAIRGVIRDWRHAGWRGKDVSLRTILAADAATHLAKALNDLAPTLALRPQPLACNGTDTWEDGYSVLQYMKVKPTEGLSGVIEFDTKGQRSDFELDIVEESKEGFRKIGTWNSRTGVAYSRSEGEVNIQLAERWQNKTFIVTSRIDAPYLSHRKPKDGEILVGNDRFEGYSMDLIDGISKILNFTYEFEIVPDRNYGNLNKETKQWDGLIRRLLDRKADLAICDLTITYERRSAVDFTMPFMTTGISILFRKPIAEPPDLFAFMEPLAVDVWIFTATSILAVSILIFLLARMAPSDWENPHPCNKNPEELENIWNIRNCMWLTMGSLMTQGCDILPKGNSSRWVTGMWWFFALIVTSSYTANMAAFLTTDKMEKTVENVEDLAKQNKIKYGAVSGGSTLKFFKESNFSTYARMWTFMESTRPSVFTSTNSDGVDRVIKGRGQYAFLMESSYIEYVMERNCDLTQIGNQLDSKGYGIAMPVNSPYRIAISGAVLKMQENGELYQLKTKWWKQMNGGGACTRNETKKSDTEAAELKMANVGGVFLVLGCGCGMAVGIAIIEFIWNVRNIAVEEKIRHRDALLAELKFVLNLKATSKPVRHSSNTDSSSSVTEYGDKKKKVQESILRAASSFINLDKVF